MKQNRMRFGLAAVLAAGTLATVTSGALAQSPGGGQIPPEIAAKIKAWTKWRDNNKNLSNLQTLMFQVRELDKKPETQLDKKQASTMLGILKTWRTKPTMSDDQAKQVAKQISGMMTEKQLKRTATIQPPWMRQGGGGPGGGGGGGARPAGGGGGRPGGGFTFPDPPKGGFNPLNPDTLPFVQMRPQAKKGLDEFSADLSKRAK
jgi:hypothetical protein